MQLDRIIEVMLRKDAAQIVIASGEPTRILVGEEWIFAGAAPNSSAQLNGWLLEIVPSHLQNKLAYSGALRWEHFAASGKYHAEVRGEPENRILTVTRENVERARTRTSPHIASQIGAVGLQVPPVSSSVPQSISATPPPLPQSASPPPPLVPHLTSKPVEDSELTHDWKPPTKGEERAQKAFPIGFFFLIAVLFLSFNRFRAANLSKDYSNELTIEVVRRYEAESREPELSQVQLRKEGDDYYSGRGKFSDGDNAQVSIYIQSRNLWNHPEEWTWKVEPFNYGSMLSARVLPYANEIYAARGVRVRLQNVVLTRQSRSNYSGWVDFADGDKGDISVQILTFDNDGTPTTWSHSISPR